MADDDHDLVIERCDFYPSKDDPTAIGLLVGTDVRYGEMHVTLFVDPTWLRTVEGQLACDPDACAEAPLGVRLPSVAPSWPEEMDDEQRSVLDGLHQAYVACDGEWHTLYTRVLAA